MFALEILANQERQWLSLVREAVHEVRYGSVPAVRQEKRQQEKKSLLPAGTVPAEQSFSSIIRLVNFILEQAALLQASDIHLEPQKGKIRVRFRVSGILQEVMQMPEIIGQSVVSRLKVMAGMDIAKKQVPQDGHIHFEGEEAAVDIRVSSLPAAYGEVMVMRLMNISEKLLSIDELGFSVLDARKFRGLIHRPSGLMVLCGPMNSGKTSSLYAALAELNTPERNLVTLEDPIERIITGVNQVQINPQAGLTYVAGLRAVLRQDVTGILLGEIRDEETAAMAVRIALTGHLLMTTIHTENAVAVIYRLLEMGIAPYLLAATLSGIVSQRLVRRLCPHCREAYRIEGAEAAVLEMMAENKGLKEQQEELSEKEEACAGEEVQEKSAGMIFYRSHGCEHCHGTGYLGRTVLAEILVPDDAVREGILQRIPRREMETLARSCGMKTLLEDGLSKAEQGITSLAEVRRVLYGG